ncbi:4a-hydroxytetrahydrobiopterin dehydratase [Pseudomonas sp. N040]|uniref:4a-hydroxytetrahydrobiopterin dehydratase n=1 Tax=Pseudomonas sp. N040 TaxID=2785325 RepID=UPI0018A2F122|nr:4a-hydroxytetrahydrobiopterin dehydratase [Pseudomonas sp. N040]MBF7731226.1 4a-hydroxytetrahydrobiopterin dehydratase [Pseudomonas sp. N040]MBW7014869.1 4a-hydroxytetrahydrobiopterin dehydratase [Pseudomonas sp. N040]
MNTTDQTGCDACATGDKALSAEQSAALLRQLDGWQIETAGSVAQLRKRYRFADFRQALDFTNQVGRLAEEYNHHPALLTEWGAVTVRWWTHSVAGLQQNDFSMAARTDALARSS